MRESEYLFLELEEICELFSKDLILTFEIDKRLFLLSLSGVETDFTKNNKPRFEPAYAPGGVYHDGSKTLQAEFRKHGRDAASSWGPWQIMYIVAVERGFTGKPHDLTRAEVSAPFVIKQLNRISKNGANSVERMLDAYNTGSWRQGKQPVAYFAKFWKCYYDLSNQGRG